MSKRLGEDEVSSDVKKTRSQPKITLYSYWRSSCSWRVRIALALKNLDYEYAAIPLLQKTQRSESYTKTNPMQEVPALVIHSETAEGDAKATGSENDITLTQSLAIIDYIDAVYPGPSVYPLDPLERARAMEMAMIIASGMQPLQNLRVLEMLESKVDAAFKAEWARSVIGKGLVSLEMTAKKVRSNGTQLKYLAGDGVSIADLCLIPQLYNARRFNVDLSDYPTLVEVEKRLEELLAFQTAHPDKQPDAVKS